MRTNPDKHGFHPVFDPGSGDAPPLLLLHGTGGNEHDLIPLARRLSPGSPILSIRGRVRENGMPRFFRRFGEGVFDIEDIRNRTQEIITFLEEALPTFEVPSGKLLIMGYSNGANMGTSLLLRAPHLFAGGMLLRPMVIHELEDPAPDLNGKRVLLLGGKHDPISPPSELDSLRKQYTRTRAQVHMQIHESASHGLVEADLDAIQTFLRNS